MGKRKYFTANLHHSPAEFSRRTGLSRTTIWRMRQAGKLKVAIPMPGILRIPVSEYRRLGFEFPTAADLVEAADPTGSPDTS